MTAGLGICKRSLRTTEPSPSTISALRSITRRKARRTGTMVRGSNEAFSARQRTAFSPAKKRPSRRATSGTAPYATQPPKARQELGLRPRPRAEQLAQLLQLIFHGLTRCSTRRGAPLDTILPGAELRQRGAQPGMDPPGDGLRHTVERHPGSFGFADQFPHEGVALPERHSGLAYWTSSAPRRDRWVPTSAMSKSTSATKSRSPVTSSALADTARNPRASLSSTRSTTKPDPAIAPEPSGSSATRRRASASRWRSRTNGQAWATRTYAQRTGCARWPCV